MLKTLVAFAVLAAPLVANAQTGKGPAHVDITWMSVTNIYAEIGALGVLADGYISRIPQSVFNTSLTQSNAPQRPDAAAVKRVLDAIGGPSRLGLLLTGHSHFDHSFDTAVWSTLSGAPIIGSRSTCYQAVAQLVPADRCTTVNGGEQIRIADGVTMHVIRWNHSGDPAVNPELHNARELTSVPKPDPATGGLRPGVSEDFPNGGGARAYLFTVDAPGGRYSWFFHNTASAVDLHKPIVVDGIDYGAPLENLKSAMRSAGLASVDLWIGSGGAAVASLVVPVLNPKAHLPVHWDDFYSPFEAGVARPYSQPAFEEVLSKAGVRLLRPAQYMDKWHLDRSGVRPVDNSAIKQRLGFRT